MHFIILKKSLGHVAYKKTRMSHVGNNVCVIDCFLNVYKNILKSYESITLCAASQHTTTCIHWLTTDSSR